MVARPVSRILVRFSATLAVLAVVSLAQAASFQSYSAMFCQEANGTIPMSTSASDIVNTSSGTLTVYCPVRNRDGMLQGTTTAYLYGYSNANGYGSSYRCRVYAAGGGGACGTQFTAGNINQSVKMSESADTVWSAGNNKDGYFILTTLNAKDTGGVANALYAYSVTTGSE
jgi:hypothetical protein